MKWGVIRTGEVGFMGIGEVGGHIHDEKSKKWGKVGSEKAVGVGEVFSQ
jgi:hypothetical protein